MHMWTCGVCTYIVHMCVGVHMYEYVDSLLWMYMWCLCLHTCWMCVCDTCMYTYYVCDMISVAVQEKPSHPSACAPFSSPANKESRCFLRLCRFERCEEIPSPSLVPCERLNRKPKRHGAPSPLRGTILPSLAVPEPVREAAWGCDGCMSPLSAQAPEGRGLSFGVDGVGSRQSQPLTGCCSQRLSGLCLIKVLL